MDLSKTNFHNLNPRSGQQVSPWFQVTRSVVPIAKDEKMIRLWLESLFTIPTAKQIIINNLTYSINQG